MNKSLALSFILFGLGIISFLFQNCGRPRTHQNYSSSSSLSTPVFEPDNTPRLTPIEGGAALPIAPGPDLYSSSRVAGTDQDEQAHGLYPTSDGGFISTGRRRVDSATNNYDVLFQKWDSDGDLQYAVDIGDQWLNEGVRAIEIPDSYLIVGATYSLLAGENGSRGSDILLMKLNKNNGEVIEAKRLGDASSNERLNDVILVNANTNPSLVAVGRYQTANGRSQAYLVKLSLYLDIIWQRHYGDPVADLNLSALAYRSGRGFYGVGYHQSSGTTSRNSLIMRFDDNGGWVHSAHLDDSSGAVDELFGIENTGADLVAVGRHNGQRGGEGFILRFDYNANPTQAYLIGGPTGMDRFQTVKTTRDGGLVLGGETESAGSGSQDNWIVKLDYNYNIQFSKFSGTGQDDFNDYQSLVVRSDGGYAFLTNEYNSSSPGTHNTRLLMLNQYGDFPIGCDQLVSANPMIEQFTLDNFSFLSFPANESSLTWLTDDILDQPGNFADIVTTYDQFCTQ